MTVRLSVLIAAYNAEGFIDRAIQSVQNQTFTDLEIIIVDDASTDQTRDVVRGLASNDPRIRLVEMERNGGPSAARNRGISAAKGEWIAVLDADDAFAPTRLERILALIETGQFDMIADDILYYDQTAATETGRGGVHRSATPLSIDLDGYLRGSMFRPDWHALGKSFISYALLKFVIRRTFLIDHSLRYRNHVRDNEDFVFYFECFLAGARGAITSNPGYIYTQRVGSISGQKSSQTRTVVDRGQVIRSVDEILAEKRHMLSAQQIKMLGRRRNQAIGSAISSRAMASLRQGKALTAAALIVRTPSSWASFARALNKAVRGQAKGQP